MSGSTYVAVNDTYLGEDGWWQNGSLYSQILTADGLYMYGSQTGTHHNVNLTVLPNNLASLTFGAANGSWIDYVLPAADFMLSNDTFRVPVACVYPISGQYDTMPRGLFYLLLILSLVFRRHTLLSTAALGTAMTYSATAVVHLFALLVQYHWNNQNYNSNPDSTVEFGDLDLVGIYPILVAAGIMLAPILNWSTTIRRHRAQAIIIWWGVLIFVGLVPAWHYMTAFGENLEVDILQSFVACPRTSDTACNPSVDYDYENDFTYELFKHCNCVDFCSTLSPTAPMRSAANMNPWIGRKLSYDAIKGNAVWNLSNFSYFALPFIIIYGIFGILASRSSPAAVRNAFFKFLSSGRRQWIQVLFEGSRQEKLLENFHLTQQMPSTHKGLRGLRYIVAKYIATGIYLGSIAGAILSPAVFVTTVVSNELLMGLYPVSEHHDAVGAWSPWVSVALVLVAAFINRYSQPILISIRIALETFWSVFRYSKVERQEFSSNVNSRETLRHRLEKLKREISIPFKHAWYRGFRLNWHARVKFAEFVWWWKNTEEASELNDREIRAWQKAKNPKPKCFCFSCARREEEREKKKQETRKRRETFQLPYDSDNSEDEAELRTILEYLQARVKRRLGPDFQIRRRPKDQFTSSYASPSLDKKPEITSQPVPAYAELPNYLYLLKRVKRRLGENYEIVQIPSGDIGSPIQHLTRSEGTWESVDTLYTSPYGSPSESQRRLVHDGDQFHR